MKVKVGIVTSDDIKIYYTGKFQDFTARYVIKENSLWLYYIGNKGCYVINRSSKKSYGISTVTTLTMYRILSKHFLVRGKLIRLGKILPYLLPNDKLLGFSKFKNKKMSR